MAAAGGQDYKSHNFFKKVLLVWTRKGATYFGEWLYKWAFDPLVVMPIFGLILLIVAHSIDPDAIVATAAMTIALSPLWLPVGLFVFFWVTWMHYIRFAYWFSPSLAPVLLQIQLPPEVEKTPLAMEAFLINLWQGGGETTFIARVWKGQTRLVTTLEIASIEGRINYYIHTRRQWKEIIEARLYGQFPEARITEVEDYLARIPNSLEGYNIFGGEYSKGDTQALPIKTYVDWQLDKNPDKPENSVDPLSNALELMGNIGKDEYMWMHIMMRNIKNDEWYGFYKTSNAYKESALKGIKDITEGAIKRAKDLTTDPVEQGKVGSRGAMLMTETEKRKVESIERTQGKLTFECGIRICYAAKQERFVGVNVSNVVGFFASFRSDGLTNSLGVGRGVAYFDYPWQDFMDIRKKMEQHNILFRSKHRAYFFVPYDQTPVYLTTEEVATIWHFPSSVVKTPGLSRVPAKVSEAPINLPV